MQRSRRNFLKYSGFVALCAATPRRLIAAAPEKTLRLVNQHTGESGRFTFKYDGNYVREELWRLYWLLRDHRQEEMHHIDIGLLEQLYHIQVLTGSRQPIQLYSGYRTPRTNAMLASIDSEVAKDSFHMRGQAIDISMPDVEFACMRKAAIALQAGGVGSYPRSGFVHLDTGPVRQW
jgi:uncharacterized protein YcbK (DUF882 family)